MKRYLSILLCCVQLKCMATALSPLPAVNEVRLFTFASSYDELPLVVHAGFIASSINSEYPQYTNSVSWTWSHSGLALQGSFEQDEFRRIAPLAASMDTRLPIYSLENVGIDNGGYSSNQVVQWFTNMMMGPSNVWNGTAITNEGITFPPFVHMPKGSIPSSALDGGGLAVMNRDGAADYLANLFGTVVFGAFNNIWTNGVSVDNAKATPPPNHYFGFTAGDHAYYSGYLCSAIQDLIAMGYETNVFTVTYNWQAATASTNHCTARNNNLVGEVLTSTLHLDRMPGAWRTGADTNGCDNAFALMPYLANAICAIIQVTNLPDGNYRVAFNGVDTAVLTSAQLAAGWNTFTYTNGPMWDARLAVYYAFLDVRGADHGTLQPAHDAGAGNLDFIRYNSASAQYPNTSRGSTYITAMAPYVAGIKALVLAEHTAAQQSQDYVVTISRIAPRFAPFRR